MNRQFHLVRIPDGPLTPECFSLVIATVPEPKDGEVLLKVRYLSIVAANRAWMQGASYRDAVGAGTVMAARGVGEVVESRHPDLRTGDLASGDCGWQEYAVLPGTSLINESHEEPLSRLSSVYGVLEDEVDGFEKLPEALVGLLHGENRGKRLVRIS